LVLQTDGGQACLLEGRLPPFTYSAKLQYPGEKAFDCRTAPNEKLEIRMG
jgi:hypothetical protein